MNNGSALEEVIAFDQELFKKINSEWTSELLDQVLPILTDLHKHPVYLAPVLLIIVGWILRQRQRALHPFILSIFSFALSDSINHRILKPIVQRARPEFVLEHVRLLTHSHKGFSFPSNHAANVFGLAVVLSFFYPRYWIAFVLTAFTIAYSRVYVGVHFPVDVAVGALVGVSTSSLLLFSYTRTRFWTDYKNQKEPQS